jgi:SNF2 family DNA or RNA helicase
VNLREVVDSYVCEECSGDATEFVTATKGSATNNLVGRWHNKLLAARTNYLKAIEHLTLPFNDAISSKRKNKTVKSKSKAKVMTKACAIPTRVLQETPSYLSNVTMRDYQLVGTSRMISWFGRGAGGILADEMGLGKTLQTIALLSYLKEELGLSGPHLVVTPLAVLQNWANEFTRFAPQLTYKKIHGSAAERDQLMCDPDVLACKFEVYLTTYETLMGEGNGNCM